jgi:hypothetical protein
MDSETQTLLKQNIELTKENNLLLQKLIRAQKLSTIYRVVYWMIIILSTFGAYYFIQPYVSGLLHLYTADSTAPTGSTITTLLNNMSASDSQQFRNLVNQTQK